MILGYVLLNDDQNEVFRFQIISTVYFKTNKWLPARPSNLRILKYNSPGLDEVLEIDLNNLFRQIS